MLKDMRPRFWLAVGRKIAEHPLMGAGFGQRALVKAYPELVPPENTLLWHAHNLVLNYGVYAGIPGIVAILILFAALFRRFWRLAFAPDRDVQVAGLAGAAMVAGVFVRNCFNDFFIRDGALMFWGLAGMLLGFALRRVASGSSGSAESSRPPVTRAGRRDIERA
jgi:O-antigen ligase